MSYKLSITPHAGISDMPFEEYNQRQLHEISADRNKERALSAKPAGNFYYNGTIWQPLEYEGFAVVSMLSSHHDNKSLTARLLKIQEELHYNLSPQNAFYQLPAESFHQTVANTLSADRFKKYILNAGLEGSFPAMVSDVFDELPVAKAGESIRMKMVGLSVFGTAIGILGIFEDEDDYNRIVKFRSGFYGDQQLAKLDVKMTRPFIGHITLAYVEHDLTKNQKDHLASVINEINESLLYEENYFTIADTGLRRYHHLAEFLKQDNYPIHLL